jgi:hypothetical protein
VSCIGDQQGLDMSTERRAGIKAKGRVKSDLGELQISKAWIKYCARLRIVRAPRVVGWRRKERGPGVQV